MKYRCEINKQVQTELSKTAKRNSIISLVVGIIGLLAYIIISTFKEMFVLEILLWAFAVMFALGLVMLITINKLIKKASENKLICECEFDEEFMNVTAIKNEEQISYSKVYYKDLIKIKETENYVFLYPNKQMAYPVQKRDIPSNELSILKLKIASAITKKGD